MGEVYRARDTRLGRDVAVKVLSRHFDDEHDGQRLEREARAIAQLNHPRISTLHDVGSANIGGVDTTYLVMELVDGETLAARLRRGPLPLDQALTCCVRHRRGTHGRTRGRHRSPRPQAGERDGDANRAQSCSTLAWHVRDRRSRAAKIRAHPRAEPTNTALSAHCRTCRRNNCAAPATMREATCLHSAQCSTRCSPAAARSTPNRTRSS